MKNIFILLAATAATLFLSQCKSGGDQHNVNVQYSSLIYGLASPIKLSPDSTIILLADYFTDPAQVEQVLWEGKPLEISDTGTVIIRGNAQNPVSNLEIIARKIKHDLPVFASEKVRYTFYYKPTAAAVKSVGLAGNMNGWNYKAHPLQSGDSAWSVSLTLDPGMYQYRIWEDGKEKMDPNNPATIDNGQGGLNNTFQVGSPAKAPQIVSAQPTEHSFDVVSTDSLDEVLAYWQNKRIPLKGAQGRWSVSIPEEARALDRSFIRVFAHDGNKRSNDLLIPLTHGDIIVNASALDRSDMQNSVMYFMMVDRFFDGDPANNRPTISDEILPQANNLGGDLKGITAKIKDGYFDRLGINTVWISPITQNAEGPWGLWDKGVRSRFSAYHGYWPTSLTRIDNRFGNEQDFRELIDEAHKKNINVILDYVAHHVHQDHPLIKSNPHWCTPLFLPDGTMNTEKWDEHRLTTWFDTFLPTWDFSREEVRNALADTAMYWVKNYDLDGFRHDATKHIPESFWRRLTAQMKNYLNQQPNRTVFQIGETYGNPELIGGYIGSGMLDAQFDFNLYDAAVDAFAKSETNFENLQRVLAQSLHAYGAHHLMGNITGNQDRTRFISYADGSVSFAEDPKLAGWTRTINNKGDAGFKQLEWLNAFILTVPGIPCIYYGDEIGMPGANDPDNRRMMVFNNWNTAQQQLNQAIAGMVKLRTQHLALTYGDTYLLDAGRDALVFVRSYLGQTAVVVFSKNQLPDGLEITLPKDLTTQVQKTLNGSQFEVQGNVLKVKNLTKGYDIFY